MNNLEEKLALIDPSDRILLLPHCLRQSDVCQAKYTRESGLVCDGCSSECLVNRLSQAAKSLGYKGVCIAPGGSLAIKYVKQMKPRAIVAVACKKELEEGIEGIRKLDISEADDIAVVIIPLSKDGCVNTEVDADEVLVTIALGCPGQLVKEVYR